MNKNHIIVCGGEKYIWHEGEGVMFDDMNVHHVKNPTNYRRAVLFIDVMRNDLPFFLDIANKKLLGLITGNSIYKDYDTSIHQQQKI